MRAQHIGYAWPSFDVVIERGAAIACLHRPESFAHQIGVEDRGNLLVVFGYQNKCGHCVLPGQDMPSGAVGVEHPALGSTKSQHNLHVAPTRREDKAASPRAT